MTPLTWSQRARGEDGLSLVELLVTMALLGVVGVMVTSGVIAIHRANYVVNGRLGDQGLARTAVAALTRDVRAAAPVLQSTDPAFRVAAPRSAEFTANLRDLERAQLLRIYIDDDRQVIEDRIPPEESSTVPDLEYDEADAQLRYVARFLVNDPDADEPVFRYFTREDDGDLEELDDFDDDGSLSRSDRNAIEVVRISLAVNREPGDRIDRTLVTADIEIRNEGAQL